MEARYFHHSKLTFWKIKNQRWDYGCNAGRDFIASQKGEPNDISHLGF